MIHLINLRNSESYEISQIQRDELTKILTGPREDRPDYIEIKSAGVVIATNTIVSIVRFKHEPERLPTREEEIEEFNKRWVPPFPVKEGK